MGIGMGLRIWLGMLLAVLRPLLGLVFAVLDSVLFELELLRVMGIGCLLCIGSLGLWTGHSNDGCPGGTGQSANQSAADVAHPSSTGP